MMRTSEVLLVSKGTLSDQVPLNGGVPVKDAVRTAEPQEEHRC